MGIFVYNRMEIKVKVVGLCPKLTHSTFSGDNHSNKIQENERGTLWFQQILELT